MPAVGIKEQPSDGWLGVPSTQPYVQRLLATIERTATPTQREEFIGLLLGLEKKLAENTKYALRSLEKIVQNPHFKLEHIPTIRSLVERNPNPRSALDALDTLLKNPSFTPDMFALVGAMADKAGARSDMGLRLLDAALWNPHFKNQIDVGMVHLLADILNAQKNDIPYSMHGLRTAWGQKGFVQLGTDTAWAVDALLRNPHFTPDMLKAIKTISQSQAEEMNKAYRVLDHILHNPHFNTDVGHLIERITELAPDKPGSSLYGLNRLLTHPEFKAEMLSVASMLVDRGAENLEWRLFLLDALLQNPNFKPEMLTPDLANRLSDVANVISKNGNWTKYVFDALGVLLQNPNVKPDMITVQWAEHFSTVVGSMCKKVEQEMGGMVTTHISRLQWIFSSPLFKPEMLGVVEAIGKKSGAALLPNGLKAWGNLLRNPNFEQERLQEYGLRLADIIGYIHSKNSPIQYASVEIFSNFLENTNFKPSMLTAAFADNLVGTLETIFREKERHRAIELMSLLYSAAPNPAFKPETLPDFVKLLSKAADALHSNQINIARSNIGFILGIHPTPVLLLHAIIQGSKEANKIAQAREIDSSEVILNLAYGIGILGKEQALELSRRTGVEYFARYSMETLEELYANLDPNHTKEKPLLLAVFNKNDDNGAFYKEGIELEQLTRHYKLILVETDTEDGFYKHTRDVVRRYGKINTILIGGHGEPTSIMLGQDTEKGHLDLTDRGEIASLRDSFEGRAGGAPVVVLVSCSTGQHRGIGSLLSDAWGTRLFAPVYPSSKTVYHLDRGGEITKVTYDVESREFLQGIPTKR